MRFSLAMLAMAGASAASDIYLTPDAVAGNQDIGLIWIQGASTKADNYQSIAETFQQTASKNGYNAYVGIPEFVFDTPEPLLIDHYVSNAQKQLKENGFTGDKYYIAAHSLGGVMAQDYVNGKSDQIAGQILTGSVIVRKHRSLNDDGTTHFDYDIPTLTLSGEKDGLMRVTRGVEAYWHQETNIEEAQAGMFPVQILEGVSHWGFASGDLPSNVKKNDLSLEVSEEEAHQVAADNMVSFINTIEKSSKFEISSYTTDFASPLIESMHLEGYYNFKPACYDSTLVNQDSPTCLQGSPWISTVAQKTMGGLIDNSNINIHTQDNFHRVYTVTPVHLPQTNNTCAGATDSGCTLETISVSENLYETLDTFDSGFYPIAATEMRAKLLSRQKIQVSAGWEDTDFHEADEVGQRCEEINQKAIDWALENAGEKTKTRYQSKGEQLTLGDDMGPYNEGPLWIWTYMNYSENDAKTEETVKSTMMRTPVDYGISAAAGFHYCKVLSPFHVMEWMYVDSLYTLDGTKNQATDALFLQ